MDLMKDEGFTTPVWAVTIDQQRSRRSKDRIPGLLQTLEEALAGRVLLAPERTAGDEVQLLTDDSRAVVDVLAAVQREGGWWVGIGLGEVELPLPGSTREARGPAYLAARQAVEQAKSSPVATALRGWASETVSGDAYGETELAVHRAESALWLLCELWQRRSREGWQMVDLLERGMSVGRAAEELGVSASAASQRHRRAAHESVRRGMELAVALMDQAARP